MPRIKDEAICIRHLDWSETSQIVSLFTRDHGVIRGVAKGSKRLSPGSSQRFSGGIALFSLGEVVANWKNKTLMAASSDSLSALTEWDLQEPFPGLRKNYHAQQLAMYAADLIYFLIADHAPHSHAFDHFKQLLEQLGMHHSVKQDAHEWTLLKFQWSLLKSIGYELRLDVLVNMDEVLNIQPEEVYFFSPEEGGLVRGGQKVWPIRGETLLALNQVDEVIMREEILNHSVEPLSSHEKKIKDTQTFERANRFLCTYYRHIIGRQLFTMNHILHSR